MVPYKAFQKRLPAEHDVIMSVVIIPASISATHTAFMIAQISDLIPKVVTE